jgi:hypothetical protein
MTRPLLLEGGVGPSHLPRYASMSDAKETVVDPHPAPPRIAAPDFDRVKTRAWRANRADMPAMPATGPQ